MRERIKCRWCLWFYTPPRLSGKVYMELTTTRTTGIFSA